MDRKHTQFYRKKKKLCGSHSVRIERTPLQSITQEMKLYCLAQRVLCHVKQLSYLTVSNKHFQTATACDFLANLVNSAVIASSDLMTGLRLGEHKQKNKTKMETIIKISASFVPECCNESLYMSSTLITGSFPRLTENS